MSGRRPAGLVALFAVPPAALALASDHLAREPGLLVASTTCAALAVGGLAVQPLLLIGRGRSVREHRLLGAAIVVLVLAHVVMLLILAPDDALFAMSPDGPTRARMALIATIALMAAAILGATGPRLPLSRTTWRILHAYLATLVVVLGVGHAVLTDGALDGAGTPLLLGLGAVGVLGVGVALVGVAVRRAPGSIPAMGVEEVEVRDVADGLWLWRQRHPSWEEGADWEPAVASFAVESRGVRLLLDPLAPAPSARAVWDRIGAAPPDAIVVLKPDHVRDVDLFVRWYDADAYGPQLYWRDDVPETELARLQPGDELPGGLLAVYDGRGTQETPLYLPEQRALVFADALTAPGGELRVWATPWHEERVLPALRALLDLPFEHVLVSHGEPVHTRADFEAALGRPPWSEWHGA